LEARLMAGDRQLVRNAVAAYFGGQLQTADAGTCYQGGPLASMGLGTAFPYLIKGGAPDTYYTAGQAAGAGWGAVLTVRLGSAKITRDSMGGQTSGWRMRRYQTICSLEAISYQPHVETTEAAFDDLVDAFIALIYADRTLGTTNDSYPTGRLITQAGETAQGARGIEVSDPEWQTEPDRGRSEGGLTITFDCDTFIAA
jgi:hypothetical protein